MSGALDDVVSALRAEIEGNWDVGDVEDRAVSDLAKIAIQAILSYFRRKYTRTESGLYALLADLEQASEDEV